MGFKRIFNWLRDNKGVATSLIEATATVAVGAVLAGVAVGGAIDAINNSKVQAAIGDVSAIGQGVITFYKDSDFFPLYSDGSKTGANDPFYGFLVSENGTYPTDSSTPISGGTWSVVNTDTTPWGGTPPLGTTGAFGTQPGYTAGTDGNGADSIEDHLIRNILGNTTGKNYPLRGQYSGDPNRGWSGPYITTLPKTDPWGDKYIINVRNLDTRYLTSLQGSSPCTAPNSPGALPTLAVIVISAGPNRNIETPVDQCASSFAAQGDDIIFRIK